MSRREDQAAIKTLQERLDECDDQRADSEFVRLRAVAELERLGYEVETETSKIHGHKWVGRHLTAQREGISAVTIRKSQPTKDSEQRAVEDEIERQRALVEDARAAGRRDALAFVIHGLGLAYTVDRFESDLKAAIDVREDESARKGRQAAADRIKALNPNPFATGGIINGPLTIDGAITASRIAAGRLAASAFSEPKRLEFSDTTITALVDQLTEVLDSRAGKPAKKRKNKPTTPEKDCS